VGTTYRIINQATYEAVNADYFAIDKPLPADVFMKDKSIIQPIFYKGTLFTQTTREFLKEKGMAEVYLRKEDLEVLHQTTLEGIPRKNHVDTSIWDTYASRKEEYCQICKDILIPGTEINFSLFVQREGSFTPLIEAGENLSVTIDDRVFNTDGDLLIRNSDISRYKDYLSSLKSTDIPQGGSATTRVLVLKENSKVVLKSLLDNPRSGEKIKEIEILVKEMIDSILGNRNTVHDLTSLKTHDYYTYTHSVNVAVLSIGLGVEIGLSQDRIESLGMGSMLHDIGKSAIPIEILNKPGKLTDEEFMQVKGHVIEGEKIVRSHKGIRKDSLYAVTEHHERLSGGGYPFKLSGKKISLFGRISAIVDVYDAMTTHRCYRPACTPFYTLTMATSQHGHYDPDLLTAFIKMLGKA